MSDVDSEVERALALAQLGRPDAARDALLGVAGEGVGSDRWQQVSGIVALRSERLDDAEHHFRSAVQAAPQSAAHWYNLAVILEKRGRLTHARDALATSMELDPEDPDAHLLRADLLISIGRLMGGTPEDALAEHAEAVRLGADGPRAARKLVWILESLGRGAEARKAAKAGLESFPEDQELQTTYVRLLGDDRSVQGEAGEVLRSVLAASPQHEDARRELLRRLSTLLFRSRTGALVALVLSGAVSCLPHGLWSVTAGVGVLATLGFMAVDGHAARRLVGSEAYSEYLDAHPGVRRGRGLVMLGGVLAWIPLFLGGLIPQSPDSRTWLVLVTVTVVMALAWAGGTAATNSLSADAYDPEAPGSRGLQREAWLLRLRSDGRRGEWVASLVLAIVTAILVRGTPPGTGQIPVALALNLLFVSVAEGVGGIHVARGVSRGVLPRAKGRPAGVALALVGVAVRLLVVAACAWFCVHAGVTTLAGEGPPVSENPAHRIGKLVVPDQLTPAPLPTFSPPPVPTFAPPTFPSFDVPDLTETGAPST